MNSIGISVFGYENKKIHPIYVPKKCYEEKHVDVLMIRQESKRQNVLLKDFNIFMYDHTLHREKKNIFVDIVYQLLVQKKY